jgi:CRP-like cAMP-binding protein
MGRRARQFSLTDADRTELERISRSRTESRQFVERARIILGCFEGVAQNVLAKMLGTRPNTISKWRADLRGSA